MSRPPRESSLYDLDEDDLKRAENVMKNLYDALDDFMDAAEDAGVDKDDLRDIEGSIESLSNGLDDFDDIRDGGNSADSESLPALDSARDNYLDDIEELNSLFDVEGDFDDVKEAFKDLDVKTSEGQAVEKALKKYIDVGEDLSEISLDDMDKDDLKRVENVAKDLYDALDDFMDAAEDAGLDEDDLKDMEETIESLSDFLDDFDDIRDGRNSAAESVPMPSSSKDDYLDDIREINSLNDADISSDPEEMADDLNDILKDLKLKTPEGKAIKKDLQDMVDILDRMVKNIDNLDEDEAEEMYNDIMEIYDRLEDHVNDFIEAAEEAGVDDDDVADLDIDF